MVIRTFLFSAVLIFTAHMCNTANGIQYKPKIPTETSGAVQLDIVDKYTRSGRVQISRKGERVDLLFQPSRDNLGCSLGSIRTLSFPNVQKEFDLNMALQARMETLIDELVDVDSGYRFDKFADCFDLQIAAEQKIDDFSDDVEEFMKDLSDSNELTRLKQIERRFMVLGSKGLDNKSIRWLENEVRLTSLQKNEIKKVLEETELPVTNENLIDELAEILDVEQMEFVETLVEEGVALAPPRGLEGAHFRVLYRYEEQSEVAEKEKARISNSQVYGISLLPNGRLTDTHYHEYRGSNFYGRSVWQQIHHSIVRGELEWLEIVDEQKVELKQLQQVHERADGMKVHSYVGQDALVQIIRDRPDPSCKVSEYEAWEREYSNAKDEADETLYQEIDKILLPHQFDAMELSLGLSRLHQVGILNALLEDMLGDTFLIDKSQKRAIRDLMGRFFEKSNAYYDEIDSAIAEIINDEQNERLKELFGSRPEIYPSLWLAFPL